MSGIEALYDNPTSGIAQTEQKKDAPADKPAAFDPSRLYDTKHSDTKARKDEQQPAQKSAEDRAAVLYSPDSTYSDTTLVSEVPASATAEQVAAANAEYRGELAKMEMPGVMARTITDRFTAAMRTPIDDATYERKAATFKTDLAARFGSHENVEERLADVRRLLAMADPALVTAMVESGLNVDVDTIVELANHARSLKGRGRLR